MWPPFGGPRGPLFGGPRGPLFGGPHTHKWTTILWTTILYIPCYIDI